MTKNELAALPTPECDASRFVSEYSEQEDVVPYAVACSLERRLGAAVAALEKWQSVYTVYEYGDAARQEDAHNYALETLAAIKASK